MAKKEINDELCGVCGQYYDAFYSYLQKPFINGKKYHAVCHCCCSTLKPKIFKLGNGEVTISGEFESEIRPIQDIVDDGFNIETVQNSYNAIGLLLGITKKKIKECITSIKIKKSSKKVLI